MKRIASADNPAFKALRRRSMAAGSSREPDVAWLEGIHLAEAFVASGGVPEQVVIGASACDRAEVGALLERMAVDAVVLDDALFDRVSLLVHGIRLLTIAPRPRPVKPTGLVATSVLLDRVQDPGNVGSILRSAAAAGICDVYLSSGCAAAWSPKVLRAAMGAHFVLRLFEDCDLVGERLSSAIPWVATSPHARRALYEADLTRPVAWVFGTEGQGLPAPLVDDAAAVRIPQPGHGESLNVAAAAAVCFFEQVRQQGRPGHGRD